jgi:hypothetical protein
LGIDRPKPVAAAIVARTEDHKRYLAEANTAPRPFTWTKDPDEIVAAVRRGQQALDSIH